jgi:addiction module RelE/StbE family toxin
MVKLIWTEISRDDLKDIFDYISNDSEKYAAITVGKLYNKAQVIIQNPQIGRITPELNNKYIREIIVNNYRIIYRIVSPMQVDILRILHSARHFTKKLF